MDLSAADRRAGLRVESSREVVLAEGETGDPRGLSVAAVEVEVSWVEPGRSVRERVGLFQFKEMVREAGRRGLPVTLAPGYAHRRGEGDPALETGTGGPAPGGEAGEKFDLLGLVRSLLRQEAESLGPAYG